MTVKKQVKQAYEGFFIKVGLSQDRDGTSHKRRVRIIRQRDASVDSSICKDVLLPSSVEKQHQIAVIMQEHPGFDEQDAADFSIFLSFKEQRADLYKKLADS